MRFFLNNKEVSEKEYRKVYPTVRKFVSKTKPKAKPQLWEQVQRLPDIIIGIVREFVAPEKMALEENVRRYGELVKMFGDSVPDKHQVTIFPTSMFKRHYFIRALAGHTHRFKPKRVNIDALENAVAQRNPDPSVMWPDTPTYFGFGYDTATSHRVKCFAWGPGKPSIKSFKKSSENYKYFLFLVMQSHYQHKYGMACYYLRNYKPPATL